MQEVTENTAVTIAIPAWCAPPVPLIGRADLVQQACAAAESGPITLVGRPGVGTTAVAGAVALSLATAAHGRVIAVRADPAMEVPDLLRTVGLELGAYPPASADAVAAALGAGPVVILVDDADLAAAALGPLVDLPARFVLTARRPLAGATIQVPPLADADLAKLLPLATDPTPYAGLPAAAALGGALPGQPFAAVEHLPPGAEVEIAITSGVPEAGAIGLPSAFRLPVPGRVVARRCVREALGLPQETSSESLSAVMRGRRDDARAVAAGLQRRLDVADIAFFALAARRVADPDLGAYAAAACARHHLRLAEPARAAAVAERVLRERPPGDRVALGLLHWLYGDAALARGEPEVAHEAHKIAAQRLLDGGWRQGASLLARAAATYWARVGHAARTRRWLADAREHTQLRDEPAAWAEGLRIAGDLAARSGELVSASTLYDEALAVLDRGGATPACTLVRAATLCSEAVVEAARGDTGTAEELLAAADRLAQDDGPARALVAFRRAELALQRGRHDDAAHHLRAARHGFALAGDPVGVASAQRLAGDLHAAAGRVDEAGAAWRAALSAARSSRDLRATTALLARLDALGPEGAVRQDLARALALVGVGSGVR